MALRPPSYTTQKIYFVAQSTDAEGVTGCKISAHFWKMNALEDSRRPSANSKICTLYENSTHFYKMNDLQRQSSRPQQTFERWTPRKHESPNKLARQSEAKRKQTAQSEANVCRRRMQSRKNLSFLFHTTPNNAQNTQHKLGLAFSYLERNKWR